MKPKDIPKKSIHTNKKALSDYEVLKEYEAGLRLLGHEVKAMREHGCNLRGSYVSLRGEAPVLRGMRISPYANVGNKTAIEPARERELLLHNREIRTLREKLEEKGLTLIVTEIYWKGNLAKARLALARGRKKYEKKQILKERDVARDMDRTIRERFGR